MAFACLMGISEISHKDGATETLPINSSIFHLILPNQKKLRMERSRRNEQGEPNNTN